MKVSRARQVFFIIVLAQFLGTSLWFGGNALLPQLRILYHWPSTLIGLITSATQIGFIIGTLTFALAGLADRYSPSRVFFYSSLLAAFANGLILVDLSSIGLALTSRVFVGFFLAGIYPIGMKIASDWSEQGLGHWLGALVGALVVGTAFPFLLRAMNWTPDAQALPVALSLCAIGGGILVFIFVPDGPFRKVSGKFDPRVLRSAFTRVEFRRPALGYFGHMWELYAAWAFFGVLLETFEPDTNNSLLTFFAISAGGVGCLIGGLISIRWGSHVIATTALGLSGICCLLSPFLLQASSWIFYTVMIIWGVMAAADSPQFSALVAKHAPSEGRGSAITLVVCIGFAISIVSIQLLAILREYISTDYLFLLLAPGPAFGVISMLVKRH